MSPGESPEGTQAIDSWKLHWPDVEISCAVEAHLAEFLCIGTENGKIGYLTLNGGIGSAPSEGGQGRPVLRDVAPSGDAINGIAFSGQYCAVTTRSDIVVGQVGRTASIVLDMGAHDVVATPSGGFVASRGIEGLVFLDPSQAAFASRPWKIPGKPLYLYKLACLGRRESDDVFVSAARKDGIATIIRQGRTGRFQLRTIPGLDVVSVCTLGSSRHPNAIAAIATDLSLILIRDGLTLAERKIFNLGSGRETAYRVLRAQGHLVVLTDSRVILLKDFVSWVVDETSGGDMVVFEYEVQAVDASIAFDRWLLIVEPDGLKIIDINEMVQSRSPFSRPIKIPGVLADWEPQPTQEFALT